VVPRAAPSHEFNQSPLLLKSQQNDLIHEAGFLGAVAPKPCWKRDGVRGREEQRFGVEVLLFP